MRYGALTILLNSKKKSKRKGAGGDFSGTPDTPRWAFFLNLPLSPRKPRHPDALDQRERSPRQPASIGRYGLPSHVGPHEKMQGGHRTDQQQRQQRVADATTPPPAVIWRWLDFAPATWGAAKNAAMVEEKEDRPSSSSRRGENRNPNRLKFIPLTY